MLLAGFTKLSWIYSVRNEKISQWALQVVLAVGVLRLVHRCNYGRILSEYRVSMLSYSTRQVQNKTIQLPINQLYCSALLFGIQYQPVVLWPSSLFNLYSVQRSSRYDSLLQRGGMF